MSSERNATPERSIDDQLITAVNILRAAELHDAADWIQAVAFPKVEKKIAEVSALPPEIVALHRPITNEEHGTEPGLISGYCHRCRIPWPCLFSPERLATPNSKPSRSDAVKEAIATLSTGWIAHAPESCADAPDGWLRLKDERICAIARAVRVLIAAIADAERKLAESEYREAKVAQKLEVTALADNRLIVELSRGKADAEKRAKDAEQQLAFHHSMMATIALAAIDAPAGDSNAKTMAKESVPAPRVIDGKFMAAVLENAGRDAVVIVKMSSGEIVPEDEPLVLMRGRDHLMLPTLGYYRERCRLDGCNDYQLGLVDELIAKFVAYASDPSRMKQPGITRGAAWNPDAPHPEPANAQGSEAEWRAGDAAWWNAGNTMVTLITPITSVRWKVECYPSWRSAGAAYRYREVYVSGLSRPERDDALERAAEDALVLLNNVFDFTTKSAQVAATINNLSATLAQRARKVE